MAPRRARAAPRPLHVLVTNDDGVDAAGLDAIVRALAAEPRIDVSVVAPATNQTGAGSSFTTGPLEVAPTTTLGGHPAIAVAGTPSDAVLFAILHRLERAPDLVVSGLNAGPNLAEFVAMSGTVSAALVAARLGIPAIAASQGLADVIEYGALARFVTRLVTRFHASRTFRERLIVAGPLRTGIVLNVNFPASPDGAVRGVRVVALGRLADVTGYRSDGGTRFSPTIVLGDVSVSNLGAPDGEVTTDLAAFNHGFVSVTPLAPDLTLATSFARFSDLVR